MGTSSSFFIFLLCVIVFVGAQVVPQGVESSEEIVVGTQHGPRIIKTFLGLTYAKTQTGEIRFMPLQHHEGYSRLTAERSRICRQSDPFNQRFSDPDDEDCLTLDIYTKQPINAQLLKPVIVYLPGEKFRYGGSSTVKPDNILESPSNREVVIVVVNKLGLLGFMKTEDNTVPSNMRTLDHTMALQWIAKNIDKFGGNPGNILLFGHDSAAVSAEKPVSKKSEGLVQTVAMLGGAIQKNPWGFEHHEESDHRETFSSRLNSDDTGSSQRKHKCLGVDSLVWVPASNGEVPPNSVVGGKDEKNRDIFVARASHNNGADIPGKLVPDSKVTCVARYGVEYKYPKYEVLTNPKNCKLTWVQTTDKSQPPSGAVLGGVGEGSYIGRHIVKAGGHSIGGAFFPRRGLWVPSDGNEYGFREYEILICED